MAKQHFFKPLLPGFHSHLTIPMAFFLKNIEGRHEQKTAELRSDASKITWAVKIDGQRLTDGWKEFALAHDLRIGDIVVFRQESDMSFHVSMLGPSCCEIQYGLCLNNQKNNLGNIQRKKNPRRETESSSLDPSCFVANVTVSSLRDDRLNLPRSFVRENGLDTRCGEIVLINENGGTWTLDLKGNKSYGTTYIKRGWRSFCHANELRAGSIFTFKLIQKGKTPVLRLFSKEPEEEANEASLSPELESNEDSNLGKIQRKKRKKNPSRDIESSSLDPSCFVANITRSTLRYDLLYLPKRFMRANGLDTRCGEMILMNEKGRSWTLDLKRKNSCGTTYIKRGWRSFCRANGLRAGSFSTFKLIQNGRTLVLSLSPKEPEEKEEEFSESNVVESLSTEPSDEESSQDEKSSQECSKTMAKKSILIQKASSSASQSRLVTITLTRYSVSFSRLTLPIPFTKVNGIQNAKNMCFLDKHGVKWSTSLRFEKDQQRMRLVGGWKEFCDANDVKIGESIMLELVLEADKSFILKFCSKVMQEIK